MAILSNIIYRATLAFFVLLLVGLILSSKFSLEFRNQESSDKISLLLLISIPVAVLLTMTGTLREQKSRQIKIWLTIVAALFSFCVTFFLVTISTSGGWLNEAVLYQDKANKNVTITSQVWDEGSLGVDRHVKRIVELRPFLKYFYQVKKVDTSQLDKARWAFINIQSDIYN